MPSGIVHTKVYHMMSGWDKFRSVLGNREGKGGALIELAFDADTATVGFDDVLDDREP